MGKKLKHIRKTHVLQRYSSDCGVACLLSIIQYYGGNESLEQLREMSGTTDQNTSLLGLYQVAKQKGFDAKGIKGTIEALKNHESPVILHCINEEGWGHYVVCYGYDNQKGFLIGDPTKEIYYLSEDEINSYWRSRSCLVLLPNEKFISTKTAQQNKKRLFFDLLKSDFRLLLFTIVIGLIVALLGLSLSVFSQKLIDNLLPAHNIQKLTTGIVLLALLLLFRIGFIVLREFLIIRQSQDFNNRINTHFFSNLLCLPKFRVPDLRGNQDDTNLNRQVKLVAGNTVSVSFRWEHK